MASLRRYVDRLSGIAISRRSLKSRSIAPDDRTSLSWVALRKRSGASTEPPLAIVSAVRWIGASRIGVRDRDGKRANPNGSRSAGAVFNQTIRSNPRTDGQDLGDPVRLDNGADLHLDTRRRNRRPHPSS